MGLQSLQYCAFLVVVAAVYLHLPVRMQPVFLLGASWVFYALAMPAMLPVTIALAVFTYLCGRGLAWRGGAHKTAFLRLGVIGMLGILAFFKYNGLLGGVLHGWRAVAMPLGISFTSFAAIAYLIDATRGDCEVETSFIRLALFLNFFATVTQGPICRAGALLPQFKEEHRFDAARTVRALRLMALGLFKLVAVSDVLGLLVDEVFQNYRSYGGPMLVLAAVFYTFQLYFNFSGYSEVARAVGLLLGLELPENFKTPFFATNFSGFWSRWHISFSSWLTTRSPIFRSFTSASRKFQIWLWVMGSNMVLISSAIRNRVLSPRALAMQNRCSSPPESSPGYRLHQSLSIPSPSITRSLIESPSCRTACIRTRGLTACSGCCQIICTGQ